MIRIAIFVLTLAAAVGIVDDIRPSTGRRCTNGRCVPDGIRGSDGLASVLGTARLQRRSRYVRFVGSSHH